jgi:outer membrane biosynthesis protein TonB
MVRGVAFTAASLSLHAALLGAIRAGSDRRARPAPEYVEIELRSQRSEAPLSDEPPKPHQPPVASALAAMQAGERTRVPPKRLREPVGEREPAIDAATGNTGSPEPAQGEGSATARSGPPAATPPGGASRGPDLFASAALGRAAGIDLAAPAPSAFRPRRGVGGGDGRGGVDAASFLAEDAARDRAAKGLVSPKLRDLERRLGVYFDPPFAHVDVSNRRELLHKQFMARLGKPPKVAELQRGIDPTRETNQEKLERQVAEPFFLGRRAEVFVRQRPDGSIIEMTLRLASGYRAFDEEALDAVEKALADRPAEGADVRGGEVRTLWRLEATAYVVYSPYPAAQFDESTGKMEWVYPLEKKVDRAVRLIAVY